MCYIFISLSLTILLSQNIYSAPSSTKIDPSLQTLLAVSNDPVDILISFIGGTSDVHSSLKTSKSFEVRSERLAYVKSVLENHASNSQQSVLSFLAEQTISSVQKVESLWISNQIYIRGANSALVQTLAVFSQVSLIKADERIPLDDVIFEDEPAPRVTQNRDNEVLAEWGIENIRAPLVWAASNGTTGEGIIIATIDTGVRVSHQALRDNFLGSVDGWHDPYAGTDTPNDANGHGTFVTGNICGKGGIGVAPGAQWSSCKGCDTASCSTSSLISCGQYFICPNSNCSASPHLVGNGWGGGIGNTFYDDVIRAWHAGGIIPFFASGNSGPNCGTVASPGDSEADVLAIGLTTRDNNTLSSGSSKGPSIYGHIKPDICAPGISVLSAYNTADDAYVTLSGISHPHASGAVALLLSKNPALSYEEVKALLFGGALTGLAPTGYNCGSISEVVYPNNAYGHGKVDVYNSFMALMKKYLT